MKVGDYCYIKGISRDYGIGQITQLNSGYSSNGGELIDIQFKHSKHSVPKKDVISSDSPIDLIEVGDIVVVSGVKYTVVREDDMFDGRLFIQKIGHNPSFTTIKYLIEKKQLQAIVTKEQFSQIEYRIGE